MNQVTASPDSFLIDEYRALRAQICDLQREILNNERWALVVCGAIWAWLATNGKADIPRLIYWSPALISALFGLRTLGLHTMNLHTGKYLQRLEPLGLHTPHGGWEHFLANGRPRIITLSSVAYWLLLVVANVLIPLLYVPYLQAR